MAYIIVLVQRNKLKYWYVKTRKLFQYLAHFIIITRVHCTEMQYSYTFILAHIVPY